MLLLGSYCSSLVIGASTLSTAEMWLRFMYLAPTHDLLLISCQKDGCSSCKIVVCNSILLLIQT